MKKTVICYDCKFVREDGGQFRCLLLDLETTEKECSQYLPPHGRYDEIKNARELISEVAHHGFSTQQHDRNRAADIFGASSVHELADLANSADQLGNITVGSYFYFIAFNIWNWEDATRFYNTHTNKDRSELLEAEREVEQQKKLIKELTVNVEARIEEIALFQNEQNRSNEQYNAMLERAIEAEGEIVTLKAKLYDLMTAGA